ncbi:alpha-ribazole phosphatase [Beggiatoa leptomitoformis]|uniref:Alpha-ribazole phosphatase n=1 Tax=Beggiatoa leptomitoformis TaxID=288004 RepID=A0A2N9YAP0_9GAMM|nr:alpha-ribazole phosphatase [Beggiatoa leptomitoformis]ALG67087.1 alpha-ribazole phosphatase [Beggiatoa leptomitoformis]AUI67521.1 alpha-ribazole phosphatase [Beggiatoa leptomitoformis]
MDIYLIRHTTPAVLSGVCYGQSDIALADSFAEDVMLVKKKLTELDKDGVIISSPSGRCIQLAENLGGNVISDSRIMELNFGEWEMKNFNDINPEQLQKWTDDFVRIAPPRGESYQTLSARCQDFWNELIQQDYQQVSIVTHAGVIRALIALLLEIPLQKSFCFKVDYGSVHKFVYQKDWHAIEYLNR